LEIGLGGEEGERRGKGGGCVYDFGRQAGIVWYYLCIAGIE